MDTHHIHDTKVSFHENALHSQDFLRRMHHEDFNGYLAKAKEHGEAHFIDPQGRKFTIEHNKADGAFSVRESHHGIF